MLGRKEAYHVMRFVENSTTPETLQEPQFGSEKKEPKAVTIADIWEAHKLLKPYLHHTPLTASRSLYDITGAEIYLKADNMQRSGSFKLRWASLKRSLLTKYEYGSGVIVDSTRYLTLA